jgi:hypothetical protein
MQNHTTTTTTTTTTTPTGIPSTEKRILVEAFLVGTGVSEAGNGRIWTECAASLNDTKVLLVTNTIRGPLPCQTLILSGKTPLIRALYKIANRLPKAHQRGIKSLAHKLHYRSWLKESRKEMEKIHKETPFDLAIHVSYSSFFMPSMLPKIKTLPVAERGSIEESLWGRLRWATHINKPTYPLPLNKESQRITGGILTLPAIDPPIPKGHVKEKLILFIDSESKRKQSKCLRALIQAAKACKKTSFLPLGWKLIILTRNPDLWGHSSEKFGVVAHGLVEHQEYLEMLERASFILNISNREGSPTACLEAMYLNTVPIATPLSWTRRCQTIPLANCNNPDTETIYDALERAIHTPKNCLEAIAASNKDWVTRHTGPQAIQKLLASLLTSPQKKK